MKQVIMTRKRTVEFLKLDKVNGKQMNQIGYHLTTMENWKEIQKKGIKRYPIDNYEIIQHYNWKVIHGIWIWAQDPLPIDMMYRLLYHCLKKSSFKFVLLKVKYNEKDLLQGPIKGQKIIIHHRVQIEKIEYMEKNGQGVILLKDIPVKSIEVVREYDFMILVN